MRSFFSLIPALGIIRIAYTAAIYDATLSNTFLHLDNLIADCVQESNDKWPYTRALIECQRNPKCTLVKVIETDVYDEGYGKSSLCYSSNISNVKIADWGRISIKGDKSLFTFKAPELCPVIPKDVPGYDVNLNMQATCHGDYLLAVMKFNQFADAARECKRRSCDYFTMFTLSIHGRHKGDHDEYNKGGTELNQVIFCKGPLLPIIANGCILAIANIHHPH